MAEAAVASQAFAVADGAVVRLTWVPAVLLDAAISAADRLGYAQRSAHYRAARSAL
ncbi:hypothetical protein [Fodinicola feengrottensis]|uniref:hypothetical protein n=1 Tax=Fodinicola feengrottensis TaxID=435914 RepID=UPI002442CDC9|nr:hypothetical protein [Fodinicola feengrottensis]